MYEDEADLAIESELKAKIEQNTRSKLEKLPKKYYADYLAFRDGEPVAFIEIKARNISKDKYDTYMISLHKVLNVLTMCEQMNMPFLLYVKWTDGLGYVHISPGTLYNIKMQKQDFRNDTEDIEPCVHIPIKAFKLL